MAALIFDKYELVKRLAVGGMGEIFLARQVGVVDRLVILKSLLPELAADEHAIQCFLDEARVAATLNHPNIVNIFEVGLWKGSYFIAMEYIEGDSVSSLLRAAVAQKQRVPLPVALQIAHDAALALDHAHHAVDVNGVALQLVHRDVSPQNLMVRIDGVTKVVDFGIARAANRMAHTRTGLVKGKVGYMAPEQLLGQTVDARCDQYSLGVVLWELLTSRRLHKVDEDDISALNRIVQQDAPPPSARAPDISPELDAIVLRALQREPGQRFARCSELAAALRPLLAASGHPDPLRAVAAYVQQQLGAKVAERRQDLTPSREDFLINLSRNDLASVPASELATRSERTGPPPRRRSAALLAGAGLAAALLVAIAAWGVRGALQRPPVLSATAVEGTDAATLPAAPASTPTVPIPDAATAGPTAPGKATATGRGDGFLTIDTRPWTTVYVDGNARGMTPLIRIRLPAGPHELLLVNEQSRIRSKRRVVIRRGANTKLELDLSSAAP